MSIFTPADILLPKETADMSKWAVVACDQFTSEPEYWHRVQSYVGDAPSTLNFIVPEAFLPVADGVEKTSNAIKSALESGIFREIADSFVLVARTLSSGKTRYGLVGKLDLEAYSFTDKAQIRASERTVAERLPERVKIREAACIESPHIMLLIDDPDMTVVEKLADEAAGLERLYDFDLMEGGGHISGYRITGERADTVMEALSALEKDGMLGIMGDGNHSLAAAKQLWEQLKQTLPESEHDSHPSRFALVELNNIYSEAVEFLPIHRVVFGTDSLPPVPQRATVAETYEAAELLLEDYRERGCTVDYIHGEDTVAKLTQSGGAAGMLLPGVRKDELFPTVISRGVFPKKTFSIGHAQDKRYYLECRKIVK